MIAIKSVVVAVGGDRHDSARYCEALTGIAVAASMRFYQALLSVPGGVGGIEEQSLPRRLFPDPLILQIGPQSPDGPQEPQPIEQAVVSFPYV